MGLRSKRGYFGNLDAWHGLPPATPVEPLLDCYGRHQDPLWPEADGSQELCEKHAKSQ